MYVFITLKTQIEFIFTPRNWREIAVFNLHLKSIPALNKVKIFMMAADPYHRYLNKAEKTFIMISN